jgi:hypothetical protein
MQARFLRLAARIASAGLHSLSEARATGLTDEEIDAELDAWRTGR